MGFRFRKSVKIAPGVRLNIGKKSVGISAGVKGARVSVNSKGRVTKSVGLPGTGLSYTKTSKIVGRSKGTSNAKPKQNEFIASTHATSTTGSSSQQNQSEPQPAHIVTRPDLPPIKPQTPPPKWTMTVIKLLGVLLIAMGLFLSIASLIGGLCFTGIGCLMLHYRRVSIARAAGLPAVAPFRCRWQIVVAVLFVLLGAAGKMTPNPEPTAEQTQAVAQADQQSEQATDEKAAQEQAEKEAAEKAAAEQAAKAEREAAEKAAAEKAAAEAAAKAKAEQEAAEKAAAEQAAAEAAAKAQAEKEASEKAAQEQAAAEAAAAQQAAQEQAAAQQQSETVYVTPSGKRWHRSASCAGKNARAVSIDQVGSRTPCQKCA